MSNINENCFVWNWCWKIAATKILHKASHSCEVPLCFLIWWSYILSLYHGALLHYLQLLLIAEVKFRSSASTRKMTSNACSASSALHTVTEVLRIDGTTLCGDVGVIHHICTTEYSAKNALKTSGFRKSLSRVQFWIYFKT